jgi:pseudooxynicotine oxidase
MLPTSRARASLSAMTFQYDVIVVGGGFAGVTAARELSRRRAQVLLLEARDRLGGRTHVAEFAGQRVELGGAWIRWNQPYVWTEVQRYGLQLEPMPLPGADQTLWSRGTTSPTTEEDGKLLLRALRRFCGPALVFQPFPYATATTWMPDPLETMSAKARLDELDLPPRVHDLLDSVLSTTVSSSLDQCSVTEIMRIYALSGYDPAQMLASLGQFKLIEGTSSLIDAIVADSTAEIRLQATVMRVEHGANSVCVTLANGEKVRARTALLTVPLNVLSSIEFVPALSEDKRRAIAEGHAGHGQKLYVKVRGDLGNIALLGPQSMPIGWAATVTHDASRTLLVLFATAPDSLSFDDPAQLTATLRRYLPRVEVEEVFGWDWNTDPYSKGTWCSLRPGQARSTVPAMQAAQGSLHFASSDTASGWRGFIDGAVERGLIVAQQIRSALG